MRTVAGLSEDDFGVVSCACVSCPTMGRWATRTRASRKVSVRLSLILFAGVVGRFKSRIAHGSPPPYRRWKRRINCFWHLHLLRIIDEQKAANGLSGSKQIAKRRSRMIWDVAAGVIVGGVALGLVWTGVGVTVEDFYAER